MSWVNVDAVVIVTGQSDDVIIIIYDSVFIIIYAYIIYDDTIIIIIYAYIIYDDAIIIIIIIYHNRL